ncbi:MAG: hypothetical protein IIT78_02780 [Mycoplasmataceae bacterium]|nr:hypothetical protein [Mycoplasmataceae bacterium]
MKKSMKLILGLLGITTISAITIGSVISCSNDNNTSNNNSDSNSNVNVNEEGQTLSNPNTKFIIPYTDLSTNVINDPTTNKPYTSYSDALSNWTSTFNNLTSTQTQYENIVYDAIQSYLSNNILSGGGLDAYFSFPIWSNTENFTTIINDINYSINTKTQITNIQISFNNKNVNLSFNQNETIYLMNDNTKTKYIIGDGEYYSNTSNISFAPTICWHSEENSFFHQCFGGLQVANTCNNILTASLFENRALYNLSSIKDWENMLQNQKDNINFLQKIISYSNEQLICVDKVSYQTNSHSIYRTISAPFYEFIITWNNGYYFGSLNNENN